MADTITEKLRTARESYADRLVAIAGEEKARITYSVDGRSMSWTEYQRFLMDAIDQLDKTISGREAGEIGGGLGYVATSTYRQGRC
jgi:predicted methyltransferase